MPVTSCEQSGNRPGYHFAGAGKPIAGGKGATPKLAPDEREAGGLLGDTGAKPEK